MNKNPYLRGVLLVLLAGFIVISSGLDRGIGTGRRDWPDREWQRATPADLGMDATKLDQARNYALTGGGSGYITRGGKLVLAWGDPEQLYDLKSSTKSFGATALAVAIHDGKMKLSGRVAGYHPEFGAPPGKNRETGWLDEITVFHLATQTAGFEKPGGYEPLIFKPGTKWAYSDGGPNWLAECITLLYGRDLQELMFDHVFTPLGIRRSDLRWRDHQYRPHRINGIARREFGSGIHANVNAMARLGLLYLRGGLWRDRRIIPESFINRARGTPSEIVGLPVVNEEKYSGASNHYGLLWWNNSDGTLSGVPRDAYWSWGLYESLIVVIPSLDIVVSRAGKSWSEDWDSHYGKLKPFLEPIASSVSGTPLSSAASPKPPYPPSPVITGITWAEPSTIVRKAEGGDNWPITWADDGNQYTAYGDGWGFEPKVPAKLSMGFAKITGSPENFQGINIRTESGERIGPGPAGEKASGILMVSGVLYLWARNAANSQLAWSSDHGKTWKWSDWKFTSSFGHPAFLNYGKNYEGARDDYVYIYSHDNDSAYERADRMVMARVPRGKITERAAYELFEGLDSQGHPSWSADVTRRGAVFEHKSKCYRSSVSYNAALKRYLWCQIIPGSDNSSDTRFEGGFGIYDAPEPWGPWTTVYYTEQWDVGPGENTHLPTKWMSEDGRTLYLVFSGDDFFSVRKATLEVSAAP